MVIFFGPAGSGKSIQGQLLEAKNGWHWLSMGQLLRDSHDEELSRLMQKGVLVPYTKTNELINDAINRFSPNCDIVIDGYPRQIEQAKWLLSNQPINGCKVDLAIILDVPRSELEKRMELRGRVDDTKDAINERLRIYREDTAPVIDFFEDNAIKVVHINGVGSVEEVHDRVYQEISACNLI
jgi:adenylate kinase